MSFSLTAEAPIRCSKYAMSKAAGDTVLLFCSFYSFIYWQWEQVTTRMLKTSKITPMQLFLKNFPAY